MNRARKTTGYLLVLCLLVFASPVPPSAATSAPAVVISGIDLVAPSGSDTFSVTVSDFDASATFSVVLSVPSGTLSVTKSGSATNSAGYPVFTSGVATGAALGFTGTYSEIQTMLGTITFTASSSAGSVTVSASVAERPSGSDIYYWPGDGSENSARYYKGVSSSGISWSAAETAAKHADNELGGITGYLVRPSTYAENQFLADKTTSTNIWIAASRGNSVSDDLPGSSEQDWYWTAHTGSNGPASSEDGTKFFDEETDLFYAADDTQSNADWLDDGDPRVFDNPWAAGEPNGGWNDSGGRNVENKAVTNWSGTRGAWNDLKGTSTNASGYVVEYNAHEMTSLSSESDTATYSVATAPAPPTSVAGSVSSKGGDVDLTWTAGAANGSAISSYVLEARKNGTPSWSAVTDTDGDAINAAATISGLDSCTLYDFRVAAVNVAGTGTASSVGTGLSFGSSGLTSIGASNLELGGDASVASGIVTLTPDEGTKKGAAWSPFRVDVSDSFCVEAEVRLSETADRGGADGVAFVMQPTDTSTLSSGGGLGYLTDVNPSVAIEFDTYSNGSGAGDSSSGQDITLVTLDDDGNADYTAFGQANYDVTGDGYSLEDGNFHSTRVAYDASAEILTVLVDLNADGDFADTNERAVNDVSADLAQFFTDEASTSLVYWGWTAATGGSTNLQQVQNIKALPASLEGNTTPTATSPGAQTVNVGESKNVSVTLADNDETTAAQWRLSVTSGNTGFATTSVVVASATQATVSITGVDDGDTTITLTAVDADGASSTASFALRVGAGSAAPAPSESSGGISTPPAPVVTPAVPRIIAPTQPTPRPSVLGGPVSSPGRVFDPNTGTRATVGGAPATVVKRALPGGVSVRTGAFQFGVSLGGNEENTVTDGVSDLGVAGGGTAKVTGSGMLPGSPVQVWLPGPTGTESRELARATVNEDGQVEADLAFVAKPSDTAIAIGPQVMQVTGYDDDGNLTVVDMTINVAQGPITPEPDRSQGALPALSVGSSLATSAGIPTPVTVVPLSEEKRVSIGDGSWTLLVDVDPETGVVGGTPEAPVVQVTQDSVGSASGEGFMPGTTASVWMFSDPTLLGTVTVGEDGSFTAEFQVDSTYLPVGTHTLQVQGIGDDGYIKAANLGVDVQAPADLTSTGSSGLLWWVAGIFAILLAVVFLIIMFQRRRSGRPAN